MPFHRRAPWVACVTVLVSSSLLEAQSVAGRITVGTSGLPVRGAGVILVDPGGRPRMAALADSAGMYHVSAPRPGSYRLRVQGPPGLRPVETALIALTAGARTQLDIALVFGATQLGTVRIVGARVVSAPPGNPTKYDEFFRRKQLGFGHFLTKEDIERTGMNAPWDLLRGIPGMLVTESGTVPTIQSKRCPGGSIPGLNVAALMGQRGGRDPKQEPMLFVDGIRVRDISSLSDIHNGQIEAMEVYQGGAQVPAEAKGDACAAIFIWLK